MIRFGLGRAFRDVPVDSRPPRRNQGYLRDTKRRLLCLGDSQVTGYTLHCRQSVSRPVSEVFAFFADATNLDLLTPPWLSFRVETPAPIAMQAGARIEYSIYWHRLRMRWLTEIEEWIPEQRFVDVQLKGPYRMWRHTHSFHTTAGGTMIEDLVQYALPFGAVGRMAHTLLVRRDIEKIFDYRQQRIEDLMGLQQPGSIAGSQAAAQES